MSLYTVVSFYRFEKLTDMPSLQLRLKAFCQEQSILGTIILATEGINGTLAGKAENIHAMIAFLKSKQLITDPVCKYSYSTFIPFHKTKILIKDEIVALKVEGLDPTLKTGILVAPTHWNDLIADPAVTLIDTRNHYEVTLGTFKRALNPHTRKFREFPAYIKQSLDPEQHRKIAMFCTGGIRCEKASSYLLTQGFEEVYQLQGGILKYLEDIPSQMSLWEGKCFVFDNRTTL